MSEPRTDIQTVDLLDALVERNIYSSGDLLLYVKQREAEASRIDVETLARAFVAVGMVIDGMTAAEARQMVERLAAEYEKLS
jgi:hypothetical protein